MNTNTDHTQATLDGEVQGQLPGPTLGERTVLVDLHHTDCTEKIDRSTMFGNPFKLKKDGGDYTRSESVQTYEKWFTERVDSMPAFREAVLQLRGETLGCWCVGEGVRLRRPERPFETCHGEVILAFLDQTEVADE